MNRIILIGNGFDRAHGLKTSYKDFIDDFWREEVKKVSEKVKDYVYDDDYIYLKADTKDDVSKKLGNDLYRDFTFDRAIYVDGFRPIIGGENIPNSLADLRNRISIYNKNVYGIKIYFQVKNIFLKYITEVVSLQNWIDIEDAYHKFLNDTYKREMNPDIEKIKYEKMTYSYSSVQELHKDFKNIQDALEKYLIRITKDKIAPIEGMEEIINSNFDWRDFTAKGQEAIVAKHVSKLRSIDYGEDVIDKIKKEFADHQEHMEEKALTLDEFIDQYVRNASKKHIKPFRLLPCSQLFLNFNYTSLEKLYERKDRDVIHIHGELGKLDEEGKLIKSNNPIIFGYGDELCEEYKELETLNDNEYLENIKSIKYLETRNHKDLLSFIDSKEYQIFIFGHSCGNSDRTLLNNLFEHKNCVSIKLYYYETKDKNYYSDVIRNISRNFNDKKLLRAKVVNKEFSLPLPQVSNCE